MDHRLPRKKTRETQEQNKRKREKGERERERDEYLSFCQLQTLKGEKKREGTKRERERERERGEAKKISVWVSLGLSFYEGWTRESFGGMPEIFPTYFLFFFCVYVL